MRYAQLSGTDFFVFVRGLVYFNIACTSRCAPVWDADISRINMKKKKCKTLHRCERCRTNTSFPGRFGTARICMPVHIKNKFEFVMVGFIVILYHAGFGPETARAAGYTYWATGLPKVYEA